jgi:asparagine synthase (glutamine-hydrolysing)
LAGFIANGDGHGRLGSRAVRFFRQAAKPLEARYLAWNSFIDADLLPRLIDGHGANTLAPEDIAESFAACLRATEGCHTLNRLLYLNYRTYLLDDLLVKMDRMTMAHGLESRSPFLDTALTEYAAALPPRMKIRGWALKHILKSAFRDLLPEPILRRGKHGFGVPLGAWFAGELRDFVHDALLAPDAALRDFVRQDGVRGIFEQHLSGARDCGQQLWALLTLELWLRKQRSHPVGSEYTAALVETVGSA